MCQRREQPTCADLRAASCQPGRVTPVATSPIVPHATTFPIPLTPAIVKFDKSASSEDKQKVIADIKAAGGSIVRDDHVDSSSE